MLDLRPFDTLGRFDNDWLSARYHFSFADYYDPLRMGVGPLRVWNDDSVGAGRGFPPHPHRDMEIVSYVRRGAITHEDGLGNRGRTEAGNVQVMSAGTGIVHSEWNEGDDDMQLFQIWIIPSRRNLAPRWDSRAFPRTRGALVPLASGRQVHADSDPLPIGQDAAVLGGVLEPGKPFVLPLEGRRAYLVPTRGRLSAETTEGRAVTVNARDGLLAGDSDKLVLTAAEGEAEVVLVDVVA